MPNSVHPHAAACGRAAIKVVESGFVGTAEGTVVVKIRTQLGGRHPTAPVVVFVVAPIFVVGAGGMAAPTGNHHAAVVVGPPPSDAPDEGAPASAASDSPEALTNSVDVLVVPVFTAGYHKVVLLTIGVIMVVVRGIVEVFAGRFPVGHHQAGLRTESALDVAGDVKRMLETVVDCGIVSVRDVAVADDVKRMLEIVVDCGIVSVVDGKVLVVVAIVCVVMTTILVTVKVCDVMVRVKVCVVQVKVCVVVVQVGRSVALIHIVLEVLVVIGEIVVVVKVDEDTIVVVGHSSVVVVSRVVVDVSGTTSIIPHPISSFVVVVAASFIILQSNGSLDARVVIMVVAFSTSKKPGVVIKVVVP